MINATDINKIVVFNKLPFGKQDFKYFICYKDNKKIKPLCIFFPETNAYRIDLDENECMCFLMKDKKFLEKYNEMWEKLSNIIKKINSELISNKKYLKAEKKSYNEKINIKECSQCIYISVILID